MNSYIKDEGLSERFVGHEPRLGNPKNRIR
jgi:hypothetical protein